MKYPPTQPTRKTGSERLTVGGRDTAHTIMDFWKWSSSDLLSNTLRGRYAEFVVACALGIGSGTRQEWDAYDLKTLKGTRIEVKSASYLQSWQQAALSSISFDIRPTKGWDALANTFSESTIRQAEVYVFCLLHHLDKSTVNPLELTQWSFYVLNTSVLNERVPNQKKISLSSLLDLSPKLCDYESLKDAIVCDIGDTRVRDA